MPAPAAAAADVAAFERDGVVCLRGAVAPEWLRFLAGAAEELENDPGPMHERLRADGSPVGYFTDLEMALRLPKFDCFVRRGPCAEIAGTLMRSQETCFLYDQYFRQHRRDEHNNITGGGRRRRHGRRAAAMPPPPPPSTPWHQDQPYWQVAGRDVVSVWLPLDPTPPGYEVHFIQGSHRWEEHSPFHFATGEIYEGTGMPRLPDIDAGIEAGTFQVLSFPDAQPGDVIVFSAMTVHGQRPTVAAAAAEEAAAATAGKLKRRRPATTAAFRQFRRLATRFTGDDARFKRRSGEAADVIPSTHFPCDLEEGDEMECERFPRVWSRRGGLVDEGGGRPRCDSRL